MTKRCFIQPRNSSVAERSCTGYAESVRFITTPSKKSQRAHQRENLHAGLASGSRCRTAPCTMSQRRELDHTEAAIRASRRAAVSKFSLAWCRIRYEMLPAAKTHEGERLR